MILTVAHISHPVKTVTSLSHELFLNGMREYDVATQTSLVTF